MRDFLSDDLIDFDPIPHSYTNSRTKKKYLGVTTFIGQFEPQFDVEYWSAREAVKRFYGERNYQYARFKNVVSRPEKVNGKISLVDKNKVFNFILKSSDKSALLNLQNEVKIEWKHTNKVAIDKGSAYHQRQEDKLNYNEFRIIETGLVRKLAPMDQVPDYTINSAGKINLSKYLPDGAYAEILLRNHAYELCGQADYVFIETIGDTRYVDLDDFKTNNKLTTSNPYDTFIKPLDFLQHHKLNIYMIQLNMYAWMIEQYGFKIRRMSLTHQPNLTTPPIVHKIHKFVEPDPIKLMLNVRKRQLEDLNW